MEGIGANSNAGTDRESTLFWIHAPRTVAVEAARLIGAVALAPLLLPEHLKIEREIVIEEIRSYADDPSEQASTALDRALFGDHAFGREIAGTIHEIRRLKHGPVHAFHAREYRPQRTALAIAGDLSAAEANAIARAALAAAPRSSAQRAASPSRRAVKPRGRGEDGIVAKVRDGEQAQFSVGLPALRREDPDAPALEMLATILGDGSASRLFLEVREERGLVYDIGASAIDYQDAGALVISGGADPGRVTEALQLVTEALRRLAREAPSSAEIERARAYLAGRLERAADDPRGLAEWHASQRVLRKVPQELGELLAEIERVRPADLLRVARNLVRGGSLRVGLSAPRSTLAAVRRAVRRGDLDPSAVRSPSRRSARL
jgi:predicted Zn-dependent peptidase